MQIEQEFGTWLRKRRKDVNRSASQFLPIDTSTINRIENGRAQARFHNAIEILRTLQVDFPEFVHTFLGIDIDTTRAIQQSRQSDKVDNQQSQSLSMTVDDFLNLVRKYAMKDSSVTWLIGMSALKVGFFHEPAWSRFAPNDTNHAEQIGEIMTYPGSQAFSIEWKRPTITNSENQVDRVLDSFYEGGLVTPEDAAVALVDTAKRYNKELPQDQAIQTMQKFNRERLLLNDLLKICVRFSEEDAVKTLDLFWYAFRLDSMITSHFSRRSAREVRHLKEVGALLVTLWRWLRHIDDREAMQQFITTSKFPEENTDV